MQEEERKLVELAKENDEQAFAKLYDLYFDKIYRYIVIKIGDRTEAEDMTQQVFLNALKSISSFKWKNVPFSSWLYRIAHNKIVDHLRKKSRQTMTDIEETIVIDNADTHKTTELKMDIEQLSVAMKGLTSLQREVISLRFTADMPIAQVAKTMGKSEGAVKALQHSAIRALRKTLSGVMSYE